MNKFKLKILELKIKFYEKHINKKNIEKLKKLNEEYENIITQFRIEKYGPYANVCNECMHKENCNELYHSMEIYQLYQKTPSCSKCKTYYGSLICKNCIGSYKNIINYNINTRCYFKKK